MRQIGRVKALEVVLEGEAYERSAFLERVTREISQVQGVREVKVLTRVLRARTDRKEERGG